MKPALQIFVLQAELAPIEAYAILFEKNGD